ncbi:MAG: hypothetical protein R6X34_07580 [Chloroflexota bacterium]
MFKLFLITVGLWLATAVFIIFAIGITAALTAEMSAASMTIPLLVLGAVALSSVAADTFVLLLFARRLEDTALRWTWIGAFLVLELGTAVFLMFIALVVLNR